MFAFLRGGQTHRKTTDGPWNNASVGGRSSSAVLSRFTFEVGCVRRPMSTIRKLSQYRLKNCAGLGSSSVSVFV